MRVFVTGATGFIGPAVVRELIAHGHVVSGLARSAKSAEALRAAGATPVEGSLRDPRSLAAGAAKADGVIHLAFTFSPADMPLPRLLGVFLGGAPGGIVPRMMRALMAIDRAGIDALGAALEGSGRPLVTTFGTMGVAGAPGETAPRPAVETDPPNPRSPGYARALNEQAVDAWAERGVRASAVRLAPSVHGDGDKGLVPMLIAAARKGGEAVVVGQGVNRWSGVHRDDAARLFRLALEFGTAGARYHGAAEEGASFHAIAKVIGRRLRVPVRPLTTAEAGKRLGWVGPFIAVDNPAASDATQAALGWRPTGPKLLEDLDSEAYFQP